MLLLEADPSHPSQASKKPRPTGSTVAWRPFATKGSPPTMDGSSTVFKTSKRRGVPSVSVSLMPLAKRGLAIGCSLARRLRARRQDGDRLEVQCAKKDQKMCVAALASPLRLLISTSLKGGRSACCKRMEPLGSCTTSSWMPGAIGVRAHLLESTKLTIASERERDRHGRRPGDDPLQGQGCKGAADQCDAALSWYPVLWLNLSSERSTTKVDPDTQKPILNPKTGRPYTVHEYENFVRSEKGEPLQRCLTLPWPTLSCSSRRARGG